MKPTTPSEAMKALLEDAVSVVGKRGDQYGTPIDDFQRIAMLWNILFVEPEPHIFKPHEVAMAMICLKLSRMTHSAEQYDNWLDIAGYAACGWACVKEDSDNEVKEVLGTFVGEDSEIRKYTINNTNTLSKKDLT